MARPKKEKTPSAAEVLEMLKADPNDARANALAAAILGKYKKSK